MRLAITLTLTLAAVLTAVGACAIDDDVGKLPGAPCASDRDCGARLVCADAGGAGVCVPEGGSVDDPPVGCDGKGEGDACSDGDACTTGDACSAAGACVGAPKQCDNGQVCSAGACIDLGSCDLAGDVQRVTNTPGASAFPSLAYDSDNEHLAVVFEDDVTGRSEVFFQLLDKNGAPVGAAKQLTDGRPADANDTDHPSSGPSIVYNPDEKEFGVAWLTFGGLLVLNSNAFTATITAQGVPTAAHDVTSGLATFVGPPVIQWTGASYGVAWVDDRGGDSQTAADVVEFAPLNGDASLASFTNRKVSPDNPDQFIALAFNPRTASFAVAYRISHGSGVKGDLTVTTTNVDGDAAVFTAITTSGDPFEPALAVTPTGFALAWKDDVDGDGLGAIKLATITDGLVPSSERALTDAGENCGRPALAAVPGGLALAYAADAGGGALEIRLRILDGDGAAGPARTVGPGQRPSAVAVDAGVGLAYAQVSGSEADVFASAQCLVP